MIFELDASITAIPESNFSVLEEMIRVVMKNNHFFSVEDYRIKDWLYDSVVANAHIFPAIYRDLYEKNTQLFAPTGLQKKYFRHIPIGYKQTGMFSPKDVVSLASCSSYVVLENGLYDWRTICKWVALYVQYDTKVIALSREVLESIKNAKLMPLNGGGGNGSMVNVFKTYKPVFKQFMPYKFCAIYDSDKTSSVDMVNHNTELKQYMNVEGLDGYELRKREIENYFPYDAYKEAGLVKNDSLLREMSDVDWDYNDFSDKNGRYGVKMEKKDVLALCQLLSFPGLQSRFWNGSDEAIDIMNLLAKYI